VQLKPDFVSVSQLQTLLVLNPIATFLEMHGTHKLISIIDQIFLKISLSTIDFKTLFVTMLCLKQIINDDKGINLEPPYSFSII